MANVRAIGWLKIVKTTPRFSTAVILRAWEGIATGDFTGAGEMSVSQAGIENLEEQSGTSAAKGSLLDELDDGTVEEPSEAASTQTNDSDDFGDDEIEDEDSVTE